jgi:hypothetical protein
MTTALLADRESPTLSRRVLLLRRLAVAACAFILLAAAKPCAWERLARDFASARQSPHDRFDGDRGRARLVQESIPEGAAALVRHAKPFLFSFARNRVFLIDWPGASSLPPGMPLDTTARLAEYLRGCGVSFVVYSYGDEAGFPSDDEKLLARLEPGEHPWWQSRARLTFAFHRLLDGLPALCGTVYDDGHTWVADLRAPRVPASQK